MSENVDSLLGTVAPLLREHLGREVQLHSPRLVKDGLRCIVVRCQTDAPESGITSVIVKQIKQAHREAARGFTDWASLAFLSRNGVADLAPRFYGGDAGAGVYVIEDFGGSRTLEDQFNSADPTAARSALRTLAVQAARLNALTSDREAEFVRIRGPLPGAECVDRHRDAAQWLAGRTRLRDWFQAAACPIPQGFDAALDRIASVYADPGPWLAFTHGDFAPSNNHVAGEKVRLLDIEYGGYRHALYDITAWNILCPLPAPLVEEISHCYQAELARTLPAARDEACYREAWACLSAYRALAMLTWIPCAILQENRPWVGDWSSREAVLAALGRLLGSTGGQRGLEPITEAASRLHARLRARWPEYHDVLTPWPALQAVEPRGF